MATFRDDQFVEMQKLVDSVEERQASLTERLLTHRFRTEIASEYATHGLARRIVNIAYSLGRVFETLPPEFQDIPSSAQRSEATAHLQAVSFNVYGSMDNLARIWVAECNIRKINGRELSPGEIGLVAKCKIVRKSLPDNLQDQFAEMDKWFAHLEEIRHTTAHRVPLYIPPFMIDPVNAEQYEDYDTRSHAALREHNWDEYYALVKARDSLRFFKPMIATSVNDGANALFHPQLLADFATVELWVDQILDHLPEAEEPDV